MPCLEPYGRRTICANVGALNYETGQTSPYFRAPLDPFGEA